LTIRLLVKSPMAAVHGIPDSGAAIDRSVMAITPVVAFGAAAALGDALGSRDDR
jgi:hypothetical protein